MLFSLLCVGCSTPVANQNKVNASYIRTFFEDEVKEGEFEVIETYLDLTNTLGDIVNEKYTYSFFETNSLIVFKVVEASEGNVSKIESYTINDEMITINVKTIELGQDCATGYWWFILELTKDEINGIDTIKILKDGEEIMHDKKNNLRDKAIRCYFDKYIKSNRTNASIEDVWLFQYLGTYNNSFVGVFLDRQNCSFIDLLHPYIVEGLDFSYSDGYEILVYNNEEFYNLQYAYSEGLISYEDLYKIHENY
jgi:hypothetical protein